MNGQLLGKLTTEPAIEGTNERILFELEALLDPPLPLEDLKAHAAFPEFNYDFNEKLYPVDYEMAVTWLENVKLQSHPVTSHFITPISPDAETGQTMDELDIMGDVRAMASLIVYKDLKPPLSIGLFGNWGSGKSFFMLKLEETVNKLSGKSDLHCQQIVSIRFNSWHYSDANLWASMSSRIFEVLDAHGKLPQTPSSELENLYSNLSSTRDLILLNNQELQNTNEQLKKIQNEVEIKQTEINEQVQQLHQVSPVEIAIAVFSNPDVQKDLNQIKQEADFGQWEDLDQVNQQFNSLRTDTGFTMAALKQAYGFRDRKSIIAVMVLGLVAITALFIPKFKNQLGKAYQFLQPKVILVLGALTQITVFLKPAFGTVKKISGKLSSLKITLDELKEQERKRLESGQAVIKAELEAKKTAQILLQKQEQELITIQASLQTEIQEIKQGKK